MRSSRPDAGGSGYSSQGRIAWHDLEESKTDPCLHHRYLPERVDMTSGELRQGHIAVVPEVLERSRERLTVIRAILCCVCPQNRP